MTESPEIIFSGGSLFDPTTTGPVRGAVAVADGRILAVGSEQDICALRGPETEMRDITGQLLLPGFQDAHIHPILGGIENLQCNLAHTRSADECLEALRQYAEAHPENEWIVGSGWTAEHFEDGIGHRSILDRVVPDRPVALVNRDHHSIWANSAALRAAGIDRDTEDPSDGPIGRDADGEPDGNLYEGAMELMRRVQPQVTSAQARRGLLAAQAYLHSLGVTAWQDAILGHDLDPELLISAYIEADQHDELTMRVAGCLWWERDRGAEQISEFIDTRERLRNGISPERWLGTNVKLLLDGVTETFTAAISEPYRDACGHATDNTGISFIDADSLKEYVAELDRQGFIAHFHALGDRAVTEGLDAIAHARSRNGESGLPHHLAHLQIVRDEDLPRFAELGAVANMQMLWAAHEPPNDDLTIPFLPPHLIDHIYPFGDLHAASAPLAAGSDWPVSTPDPIQAIHVGVNRWSPGSDRRVFGGARQQLDLATALTAYTFGSAKVNRCEDRTGRLLPGYLADLAVLDRNPFDLDPSAIAETRVVSTFVGGVSVYERGN